MFTTSSIRKLAQVEEGVPIFGCVPGSPSAMAGLRYGDIVLSVNGRRTRTAEEYVAAKNSPNETYVVELRRGADIRTITIEPGPDVWPDMAEHLAEVLGGPSIWALHANEVPAHRN